MALIGLTACNPLWAGTEIWEKYANFFNKAAEAQGIEQLQNILHTVHKYSASYMPSVVMQLMSDIIRFMWILMNIHFKEIMDSWSILSLRSVGIFT